MYIDLARVYSANISFIYTVGTANRLTGEA